jgi:16S rRNA (uracil1498-N3)-methyltransferase
MRRRWIADTWSPQSRYPTHAALTGEQATHLARVLRAQPGQIYDIVANGFLHRAEITAVSDSQVDFVLHEELEADTALPIHLLLAIFKFDHFEWAVEKATELGVARITPILARRTEKHLALAAEKRVARWRRIALESSKQSRRTDIPEISDPTPLAAALTRESAPLRILLSEIEQSLTLTDALSELSTATRVPHPSQPHLDVWKVEPPSSTDGADLALAIGPEGGWTPEEMTLFTSHAWTHVTLGPRILRAETAAIAAIAVAAAHFASRTPSQSKSETQDQPA